MYRIIDKRGTGKTSRLFLLAKEENAAIICRNPEAMREKAHRYGITGLDFISYNDFIHNIKEREVEMTMFHPDGKTSTQKISTIGSSFGKSILIDDLEALFNYIVLDKFLGYTLSED